MTRPAALILIWLFLVALVVSVAAAQNQHVPHFTWGDEPVWLDCAQLRRAEIVAGAMEQALAQTWPPGCGVGEADCFAESVLYDTAFWLKAAVKQAQLRGCKES